MEIYKITNIVTNKNYIGKTSIGYLKRFDKHKLNASKGINRRLYDSMRFHGTDSFTITLLYTASNNEELSLKEIELIAEYNTLMPNGYNMTSGGDGGYTLANWTKEEREALYKQQALTRTGRTVSAETREKIRISQLGKTIKEETKEKVSKALTAYFSSLSTEEIERKTSHLRQYDGARKGVKHSEKTKELMSKSRKGKTYEEIYSKEYAAKKRETARNLFTENNPRAYELTEYQKNALLKAIYTLDTAETISENLNISLYKIRQLLLSVGINNLQKYRRNKHWKVKHENWSLFEK